MAGSPKRGFLRPSMIPTGRRYASCAARCWQPARRLATADLAYTYAHTPAFSRRMGLQFYVAHPTPPRIRPGAVRIKLGDVPRHFLAPWFGCNHFAAAWRDRDYLPGAGGFGESAAQSEEGPESGKSGSVERGTQERSGLRHLHRSRHFHP